MTIYELDTKNFCNCFPFLRLHEKCSVTAVSRIMEDFKSGNPLGNRLFSFLDQEKMRGLLYISKYGLILPIFDNDLAEAFCNKKNGGISLKKILYPILQAVEKPHSCMGLFRNVKIIEGMLNLRLRGAFDFFMLCREGLHKLPANFLSPHLPEDMEIRPAILSDMYKLYPLQRAYEIEEVLLNPFLFNRKSSLYHLEKSLRTQRIVVAVLKGKIVAKAGTNGRGFNYEQIGGVYTKRRYRNQGIGTAVMTKLLQEISSDNRMSCLFVKKRNASALALYKKLDYDIVEDFRISYFAQ